MLLIEAINIRCRINIITIQMELIQIFIKIIALRFIPFIKEMKMDIHQGIITIKSMFQYHKKESINNI